MERADRIIEHALFKEALRRVNKDEEDRIYCLHGFEHFMDVARIGYIVILEKGLSIPKEIMYSAALLHDIGRFKQYEYGVPHDIAGGEMAREILNDCGFSAAETELIVDAVTAHGRDGDKITTLADVLAFADRKSRMCMECKAIDTCKWKRQDMNLSVEY